MSKLVKVSEVPVNVNGVERVSRRYAVQRDGETIGYVESEFGIDYPGARAKVVIYWTSTDADGKPLGVHGWFDYRADAIAAVERGW